jgi:hypothetical protein
LKVWGHSHQPQLAAMRHKFSRIKHNRHFLFYSLLFWVHSNHLLTLVRRTSFASILYWEREMGEPETCHGLRVLGYNQTSNCVNWGKKILRANKDGSFLKRQCSGNKKASCVSVLACMTEQRWRWVTSLMLPSPKTEWTYLYFPSQ